MSSLRERRRKRTAETIRYAAIDLASEHGLENVTTEMISDVAGISPRTFFNYFPYKEAVFLPPPLDFPAEAVETFITSQADFLEDVIVLFMPLIEQLDFNRDFLCRSHKISEQNPKLAILKLNIFHEFDSKVTELLVKRLETKNKIDAQHIAAVIMASIRIGFEVWMKDEKVTLTDSVSGRLRAIKNLFKDS